MYLRKSPTLSTPPPAKETFHLPTYPSTHPPSLHHPQSYTPHSSLHQVNLEVLVTNTPLPFCVSNRQKKSRQRVQSKEAHIPIVILPLIITHNDSKLSTKVKAKGYVINKNDSQFIIFDDKKLTAVLVPLSEVLMTSIHYRL